MKGNLAEKPDLIYCTRHSCWLMPIRCIQRQARAERTLSFYAVFRGDDASAGIDFSACVECKQGRKIRRRDNCATN